MSYDKLLSLGESQTKIRLYRLSKRMFQIRYFVETSAETTMKNMYNVVYFYVVNRVSSSCLHQVKILQATGLPRHLSNFVFCQYHFWGQEEAVFIAPEMASSSSSSASRDPQCTVVFDSTKVTLSVEIQQGNWQFSVFFPFLSPFEQ